MTPLRRRPRVEVRNAAGKLHLLAFPASQEQLEDLQRMAKREGGRCRVTWPKGNQGTALTKKQREGGDMIFAANRKKA